MADRRHSLVSNSLEDFRVAGSQLLVESEEVTTRGPYPAKYDALVLDARLRQSLVAIRSLGHRGLRVAALDTSSKGVPAFSSRWCQQAVCAPSYEQSTEAYLAYLEQMLDQNRQATPLYSAHMMGHKTLVGTSAMRRRA